MFDGKSVLVTGGTGSFGKAFISYVLKNYPNVKKLIVYSRDELKQSEMMKQFESTKLRFFIGDVRDKYRLTRATEDVDIIIHAAAMKQVPAAEYNPMECIKTNVLGAENVIDAALSNKVQAVVALSTDKACAPINLYGATKLCSDKLFVAANNMKGSRDLRFSVVRYGNVMGSRGSVIPFFLNEKSKGEIPVTNENMTRFNITLEDGVRIVCRAVESSYGGEIFIPIIPSYRIMDIVEAIAPEAKVKTIGIRPGEKVHEEMITADDSLNTYKLGDCYVILPQVTNWKKEEYLSRFNGEKVTEGFRYNSGTNDKWLSVEEIRELIRLHVDKSFEV